AGVQRFAQRLGQGGQVEEELCVGDDFGLLTVDAADRVDQFHRIELVAAVVALVAAGAVVTADRAGALDVAVRQGAAGGRGHRTLGGLFDHVAVGVHGAEHFLHDGVVVARGGAGEQVVGQAQLGQVFHDHAVVPVGEDLRVDSFLLGLDQDGGAVFIGAGDHQHVVTRHSHVPAEHVGGDAETGDVANVPGAVGVGPGHRGENTGHATILRPSGRALCAVVVAGRRPCRAGAAPLRPVCRRQPAPCVPKATLDTFQRRRPVPNVALDRVGRGAAGTAHLA